MQEDQRTHNKQCSSSSNNRLMLDCSMHRDTKIRLNRLEQWHLDSRRHNNNNLSNNSNSLLKLRSIMLMDRLQLNNILCLKQVSSILHIRINF